MSMGIAGSIVDQEFLAAYLGMRTEVVDMSEIERRVEENIFDPEEYKMARKWVSENITEAVDTVNPPEYKRDADQREKDWIMS